MLVLDGWDGTDAHFRVRSTSRPLWHDVTCQVDDGLIICLCENAILGKNRGGNVYGPPCGCKHARLLRSRLIALMADPDLSPEVLAALVDDRFKGHDA